MKMLNILIAIFTLLILDSCSLIKTVPLEEEYNRVWIGKTYSDIVTAFGAPDRVEYDGRDGDILIYEDFTTTKYTDVDTHFGNFDPDYTTKVRTEKKYIHFFVNSNDECYLVRSNKSELDKKSYRRWKTFMWTNLGIVSAAALLIPLTFL